MFPIYDGQRLLCVTMVITAERWMKHSLNTDPLLVGKSENGDAHFVTFYTILSTRAYFSIAFFCNFYVILMSNDAH